MRMNKDLPSTIRSKRAKSFLAIDFHELNDITDAQLHTYSKKIRANTAHRTKQNPSVPKNAASLKRTSTPNPSRITWTHRFSLRKKEPTPNKIKSYERNKKALDILPYRISAFFIDILILGVPILLYLYYYAAQNNISFGALFFSKISFFIPVLLFFYFIFTEGLGGQSIGKMLMNIEIVENDNYKKPIGLWLAMTRIVYFLLGFFCFGLGLISALKDGSFRTWHDKVTRSIVHRRTDA